MVDGSFACANKGQEIFDTTTYMYILYIYVNMYYLQLHVI